MTRLPTPRNNIQPAERLFAYGASQIIFFFVAALVYFQVSDQMFSSAEGFVADGTSVGFIYVVFLHVFRQVFQSCVSFIAPITFVYQEGSVQSHVTRQVIGSGKSRLAHVTHVYFVVRRLGGGRTILHFLIGRRLFGFRILLVGGTFFFYYFFFSTFGVFIANF
jgi:hypothetical protein